MSAVPGFWSFLLPLCAASLILLISLPGKATRITVFNEQVHNELVCWHSDLFRVSFPCLVLYDTLVASSVAVR